jgi:hypothetical protein
MSRERRHKSEVVVQARTQFAGVGTRNMTYKFFEVGLLASKLSGSASGIEMTSGLVNLNLKDGGSTMRSRSRLLSVL